MNEYEQELAALKEESIEVEKKVNVRSFLLTPSLGSIFLPLFWVNKMIQSVYNFKYTLFGGTFWFWEYS